MNNLDALFKLLVEADIHHRKMCHGRDCDDCQYDKMGGDCREFYYATYLDAHGVVVKTEVVNE